MPPFYPVIIYQPGGRLWAISCITKARHNTHHPHTLNKLTFSSEVDLLSKSVAHYVLVLCLKTSHHYGGEGGYILQHQIRSYGYNVGHG